MYAVGKYCIRSPNTTGANNVSVGISFRCYYWVNQQQLVTRFTVNGAEYAVQRMPYKAQQQAQEYAAWSIQRFQSQVQLSNVAVGQTL
jgi:hypothetical protein